MSYDGKDLVDWAAFAQARAELGAGFVRILGYFREDGLKSVLAIEEGIRAKNSAAIVIPAHTLKGESLQFGAEPLGALAEHIEKTARRCVELRQEPDELISEVVKLRPLFEQTLGLLEREANPIVERKASNGLSGFGRRPATFGRA